MDVRMFSVAVVGAAYPNKDGGNRRTEITFCDPGEMLKLEPEPKNPHDEHAIAVLSARGFQIGYVASQRAVFLKGLLRAKHELTAIFQGVAPFGAIARIGIDCYPELPPPTVRKRHADYDWDVGSDEFWPDEQPDY
jgi:hypothetical protein